MLRTLIADMQLNTLPEKVPGFKFIKSFRTGLIRTKVYRIHITFFEKAIDVAFNATF